jgi:thiosulfate reductase cytochrome b subunit
MSMRVRPTILLLFVTPFALMTAAAYIQWGVVGLPPLPQTSQLFYHDADAFPIWMRYGHYINLFFMILIIRSGLQILMDHPRLYWNVHCTPGTEWLRLTPVEVPRDRLYTAKDDARYLSPWIGLPGYRHTIGMARHWHFMSALFWIVNGLVFVTMLFATQQWHRLVPTSWSIIPDAWTVFVHYATFHLPQGEDAFYHNYNALQQLAYFSAVFVLAPLAILTGPSMSPALTNRFPWYPKLPGNRQIGRSLHFLILCAYLGFIAVHVSMVVITGFARNMNHIVAGTDDSYEKDPRGLWLGLLGIAIILAVNYFANWIAWKHPRVVQHFAKRLVTPLMEFLLNRAAPAAQFSREDISPFFWPNGKLPTSDEYKALEADGFHDYRLKVHGLVENPVELSMDEIKAMPKQQQITLHHCIQGWSGIAEWGGLPMAELIALVRPKPNARVAVFYSFGEGLEGGPYFDTHTVNNLLHSHSLLAYEMNYEPLSVVHGGPLRLRVENQLGFKMVKWVRAIEFVETYATVGEGEGGYNEDHEYFGELANI